MTANEVLSHVGEHLTKSQQNLEQLANIGDFINYRGIKRMAEYYAMLCAYQDRNLDRYVIGCTNMMPKQNTVSGDKLIDDKFYTASRYDVDPADRKKYASYVVEYICKWLKETKETLEKAFSDLAGMAKIADANYINCMIKDYTCELKYFERYYIEYKNVEYMAHHMERVQEKVHDCYQEKTDKLRIGEY